MRRHLTLRSGLLAGLVALSATPPIVSGVPAHAGAATIGARGGFVPSGEGYVDGSGVVVIARDPGGRRPGGGGGGSSGGGGRPLCRFVRVPGTGLQPPRGGDGRTGYWVSPLDCGIPLDIMIEFPVYWVWSREAQVRLRQQVVDRLDLLAPRPAFSPPATQVTGVRTWFWLDQPALTSRPVATARLGGLTVTGTATPTVTRWRFEDRAGRPVGQGTYDCRPPLGTPYRPDRPAPACSFVLARLPAGDEVQVSVQPRFSVEVVATTATGLRWTDLRLPDLAGPRELRVLPVRAGQAVVGP